MENLERARQQSDEGGVKPVPFWLVLMEALGFRRFYVFVAQSVQEPVLPSLRAASTARGWSAAHLEERVEGSRYFWTANLVRALLHVPVMGFCYVHDLDWLTWLFGILIFGHVHLAMVEVYKSGVARLIPADEEADEIHEHMPGVFGERWFAPKKWETEKVYRWLGIRWFQALTTWLIYYLALSAEDRRKGKQVEYLRSMEPHQILRFETATRVGEIVHFVMGALDAVPLVLAFVIGADWGWTVYLAWIFWGDTWLGFLQRYHRLRIWKIVVRCRKKLGQEGAPEA